MSKLKIVESSSEFLSVVEKSGLLNGAELESARKICSATDDPKVAARKLLSDGLLTHWQATQLLAGFAGLVMGKYELMDVVSKNDLGRVYLAEHVTLGQKVSLHTVSTKGISNPEAVARFQADAEKAKFLEHPHLLRVLDVTSEQDRHFVVTPHVNEGDLQQRVEKTGKLGILEALKWIGQAAEGLACLHAQGILHRDLNPANLLIDAGGVLRVQALGLGHLRQALHASNEGGGQLSLSVLGYTSPEQVRCQDLDARTDIYALGGCLYFLLTGRVPFASTTDEEREQIKQSKRPLPLTGLNPDVSPSLAQLYERLTAMRAVDRPGSMADVVELLKAPELSGVKDAAAKDAAPREAAAVASTVTEQAVSSADQTAPPTEAAPQTETAPPTPAAPQTLAAPPETSDDAIVANEPAQERGNERGNERGKEPASERVKEPARKQAKGEPTEVADQKQPGEAQRSPQISLALGEGDGAAAPVQGFKIKKKRASTVVAGEGSAAEDATSAAVLAKRRRSRLIMLGGSSAAVLLVIVIAALAALFGGGDDSPQVAQGDAPATSGDAVVAAPAAAPFDPNDPNDPENTPDPEATNGPAGGTAAEVPNPSATSGAGAIPAAAEPAAASPAAPVAAPTEAAANVAASVPPANAPPAVPAGLAAAAAATAEPGSTATAPAATGSTPAAAPTTPAPAATPAATPAPTTPDAAAKPAEPPAAKPEPTPEPPASPKPDTPSEPKPEPKPEEKKEAPAAKPQPKAKPLPTFAIAGAVELPRLASADGTVAAEAPAKILGRININPADSCFILLLGGDTAMRGQTQYMLRNAQGGTAPRDWEFFVKESSNMETVLATLSLPANELKFEWTPDGMKHAAANFLRNCAVKITAGQEKPKIVALRTPVTEPPTSLATIDKSPASMKFTIANLPDTVALRFEPKLDGMKFLIEAPPGADATKIDQWILLGESKDKAVLGLKMETTATARGIQIELTPHVAFPDFVQSTERPQRLTAALRKKFSIPDLQRQRDALLVTAGQLAKAAKDKRGAFQNETAEVNLRKASIEATISGLQKLDEAMAKLATTPLHMRVYCDVQEAQVTLVQTSGEPVAGK